MFIALKVLNLSIFYVLVDAVYYLAGYTFCFLSKIKLSNVLNGGV